jgi:hypothetical protein
LAGEAELFGETCPSAILFTTNPTFPELGLNPASNRSSYDKNVTSSIPRWFTQPFFLPFFLSSTKIFEKLTMYSSLVPIGSIRGSVQGPFLPLASSLLSDLPLTYTLNMEAADSSEILLMICTILIIHVTDNWSSSTFIQR